MTLQVRVVSPWFGELATDRAFFSTQIPLETADALLCDWAPSAELFSFPRRKAWYCCEPSHHFRGLGGGRWPAMRSRLVTGEFLSHRNKRAEFRVPHKTHVGSLDMNRSVKRLARAVAIVSNHGGSPWRRHEDTTFRNRFVTHPLVDLFGRRGWTEYRASRLSGKRTPANYKGEIPGDWPAAEKRRILTDYKVAVCLENVNEPNYFTEKFVEAVCAGCVPVYRPDAVTAAGPLAGAFWIDPRDHENDPRMTIAAALAQDLESVQLRNLEWLRSNDALHSTSHIGVYNRIASILMKEP
jgi:hypothetical protein